MSISYVFVADVLRKLDEFTTYPPAMLKEQVSETLAADDMAAASIANEGLLGKLTAHRNFAQN
jgi:hypothetical protein